MAVQRQVKLGLLAWAIVSAAWGSPPLSAKDARTPLAIEDLYRIEGPQAMRLAPDGRTAVFVRQWVDPETKRERNSLWMADGAREKVRPLEPGEPDARAPVFSPDGRWIAFVSTRPRPEGWRATPPVPPESEPATDLWLIRADGGPSVPLAGPQPPHGRVFHDPFYARVAFSPDGRRLVYVADDGRDPRTPQERDADVEIVRPDQGEGYTGYGPAQVWVAHLDAEPGEFAASRIDRLTDDDV
jgi:dipeptidyl aminopeptidase/acylaminoacyl peptidase